MHRRMMRRKTGGVGVLREIGETDRFRLPDDETQDPVPRRRRANPVAVRVADTEGGELLEQPAVRTQDTNRSIAGPDHLRGNLGNAMQYAIERGLGCQGEAGEDELFQTRVAAVRDRYALEVAGSDSAEINDAW